MNARSIANMKRKRSFRAAFFVVYFLLLLGSIYTNFTNSDESGNIVAGLSIWKTGDFELYSVNPPLVKAIAAAPLTLCHVKIDWEEYQRQRILKRRGSREEFVMAVDFVGDNSERLRFLLVLARLTCVPFALLGAYYSWRLAAEMFGKVAGCAAALLWAFCPNLLTWNSFVLSDAAAASIGVVLSYYFWRWLKDPQWNETIWLGVLLGITLLTKFTWLLLFAILPVLWLLRNLFRRNDADLPARFQLLRLSSALLIGVFVVNLGYVFEGSFKPLGDYVFVSRSLAGADSLADGGSGGNRFTSLPLGKTPIPLPENYLKGIDLQKVDFERGLLSYLNGKWSERGWRCFYLEAALLKIPLGAWLLAFAAAFLLLKTFVKERRLRDDGAWLYLLIFGGTIFLFVSLQTGFSRHFRYVLPSAPFFYIAASSAFARFQQRSPFYKTALCACLVWFAASSLSTYPCTLSYFNELAGGPLHGDRYFLDSNYDWGQDTWRLQRWLDRRDRNDVGVKLRDPVDAAYLQNRNYPGVPKLIDKEPRQNDDTTGYFQQDPSLLGPRPGLYAVSVSRLREKEGGYRYFFELKPIARFGYSVYLYDVSWEDAARLRKLYRLPPLEKVETNSEAFLQNRVERADKKRPVRVAYIKFKRGDERSLRNFQRALADDTIVLDALEPYEIREGALNSYDVVLAPGGNSIEQGMELNYIGAKAIRDFVRSGGGYLGVCAGAFLGSSQERYPLRLANARPRFVERRRSKIDLTKPVETKLKSVDLTPTPAGTALFKLDGLNALKNVPYSGGPSSKKIFNRICRTSSRSRFLTIPRRAPNARPKKTKNRLRSFSLPSETAPFAFAAPI